MQAAKKDEPDQNQKKATLNSETNIKAASEVEDAVVSSPAYDKMKYKELQSLWLGITASRKKAVLVEALVKKDLQASKKAKER